VCDPWFRDEARQNANKDEESQERLPVRSPEHVYPPEGGVHGWSEAVRRGSKHEDPILAYGLAGQQDLK
jgi:hypothetical protein